MSKSRRRSVDSILLWLFCCVGILSVGCVTQKRQVRRTPSPSVQKPIVAPAVRPALAVRPKRPANPRVVPPAEPTTTRPPTAPLAVLRHFGQRVLQQGEWYRKRAVFLRRTCRRRGASRKMCRIYWRSQRVFAHNYKTKRSNYRGYMMLRRGGRRVPRSLLRWHRAMSRAKYKGKKGRCYIDRGLSSSCMGFAMCAVRRALRDFSGAWGKGFVFPTWGYVNYWTNQAYLSVYYDSRIRGRRRMGIRSFLRNRRRYSLRKQRRIARRLALRMHGAFMRIVRRKLRHRNSRRMYRKLFCTNIVSGMTRFSHAQPGDLFAIAYAQKRGRRSRSSRLRFQHWGIVVDPIARKVIHNQTPGGTWGRKFTRWGIQYGSYKASFSRGRWKWKKYRRRYEKRIVFFNRLNAHYFIYARRRDISIYRPTQPSLCRDWIAAHGELYFGIPTRSRTSSLAMLSR